MQDCPTQLQDPPKAGRLILRMTHLVARRHPRSSSKPLIWAGKSLPKAARPRGSSLGHLSPRASERREQGSWGARPSRLSAGLNPQRKCLANAGQQLIRTIIAAGHAANQHHSNAGVTGVDVLTEMITTFTARGQNFEQKVRGTPWADLRDIAGPCKSSETWPDPVTRACASWNYWSI